MPQNQQLAPEAPYDEALCEAARVDDAGRRWVCLAAKGHAGDHVPHGALDLAAHTWPQGARNV
jgi:hypothetical protein